MAIRKKHRCSPDAPTQLAYHKIHQFVNRPLYLSLYFCMLYKFILFTLYNIPTCKMQKFMLSYRHKEVIPMIM